MALNFPSGTQDKECRVLQMKSVRTNSIDSGNETSWTQTGLIDLQFDNNILSDSHVCVMINCNIGEDHNNAWANPMYVTAYCATDGNLGDSTRGVCGSWTSFMGRADTWVQYGQQRISGCIQYNPSTTTPRYYLYRKSAAGFTRYIGRCANSSTSYNTGNTQMTIWELGM
tara:strand:- start:193 stop:702 length:510 start_codon:yes stop_codon:yes gene_type:complete